MSNRTASTWWYKNEDAKQKLLQVITKYNGPEEPEPDQENNCIFLCEDRWVVC